MSALKLKLHSLLLAADKRYMRIVYRYLPEVFQYVGLLQKNPNSSFRQRPRSNRTH